MFSFVRYQLINFTRSYKIIPPVTVFLGWIFILYAYKYVPILSSYAVSSIALYLIMTSVAIALFSLEEESEKHILFFHLGGKTKFLIGKWITVILITFPLLIFAEFFPILTNCFKGDMWGLHYGLSVYSHITLALFGILVGTIFSITRFAAKRYAWLTAVLVLVVSLAYEAMVKGFPFMKWILWIFPPVNQVLYYMSNGDGIKLVSGFWLDVLFVIIYLVVGGFIALRLFLKKES